MSARDTSIQTVAAAAGAEKSIPLAPQSLTEAYVRAYVPQDGTYDEMFSGPGQPRAHCAPFGRALSTIGVAELKRRHASAERQLRENGVTYNIHRSGDGLARRWRLDPVPLLIPAADWQLLEDGLAQRAHLLNLVLQDLYGPQRLVRQGILPPELIFANPGFLRPCWDGQSSDGRWLHLYAADVTRGPQARWWVIGDRTQAPSGTGYALENRLVLSRALPAVYRDCSVERLAPFFQTLLETMQRACPRNTDQPRLVLLTPGPHNETFFEQAYLARYLGITLAQGQDLTVRDRIVYLKTLGGLERVDVILRRVDDLYCDPLSLRGDSLLGIAGLVTAVRAGNVAVLNALGSGAVESPALLPFLPSLSRHFLGEELRLPSVATWWCGQDSALKYVEEHLETLVVKPSFPGPGKPEPIFAAALSTDERKALADRIRARPYDWVAQEEITFSTAPTWQGDRLEPRQVAVRTHLVSNGAGYVGLRGGLSRVAHGQRYPIVSIQLGGADSKDTWVLAEGDVEHATLLARHRAPLALSRSAADLPSRVADNLFWLGRYAERAEMTVRLLRELTRRVTDDSAPADAPELPVLVACLKQFTEGDAALSFDRTRAGMARLEQSLLEFMVDRTSNFAVRTTLSWAMSNASTVRDRISGDNWRAVIQLVQEFEDLAGDGKTLPPIGDTLDVLDRSVLSFAAFAGIVRESFNRTLAFHFLEMGRRLERALGTTKLIRAAFVQPHKDEESVVIALLEVLDNAITYRHRYHGMLQVGPALDLLLVDETNPRSVGHQLAELQLLLHQLPGASGQRPFRSPEEQEVLRALTRVRLADIVRLEETRDDDDRRVALEAELQALLDALPAMSDALTRHYLSHVAASTVGTQPEVPSW